MPGNWSSAGSDSKFPFWAPFVGLGGTGEDLALSFGIPPPPPLLQNETQYLKLTEPKEADHWFPLSLRLGPRPLACAHKLFIF